MKNFRQLKENEEKNRILEEQNMIKKLLEDQYKEEIKNLQEKLEQEREERAEMESKMMMPEPVESTDKNE